MLTPIESFSSNGISSTLSIRIGFRYVLFRFTKFFSSFFLRRVMFENEWYNGKVDFMKPCIDGN